ncbi:hypothetical protein II906_07050 [bacterium]|nr:hypothetical protein [bacterium]
MKISPISELKFSTNFQNNDDIYKKMTAKFSLTENKASGFFSQNTDLVRINSSKKKFSDYLTPKNIAIGIAAAGTVALCTYGIVSAVKKGKIAKAKDIIVEKKEDFQNILKTLTEEDFDSSKVFRANLHIHSTASDGKLEPLEILRQANEHAQKLPSGEKFCFSVADHDTVEGVKAIKREIIKHPERYKKLKFIPGLELSTRFHNPEMAEKPIVMDFLMYAFNPDNPELADELNRRKGTLIERTKGFFADINAEYPTLGLSVEEMMKEAESGHLKNICSNGYLKSVNEYVKNILYKKDIAFDEAKLVQSAIKHFDNATFATSSNIELTEAVGLAKRIGAFSSIAHPGKINFQHAALKTNGITYVKDIVSKFFAAGGDGMEGHYMSYRPENKNWAERIFNSIGNNDFLKTGGYDTHGSSITQH